MFPVGYRQVPRWATSQDAIFLISNRSVGWNLIFLFAAVVNGRMLQSPASTMLVWALRCRLFLVAIVPFSVPQHLKPALLAGAFGRGVLLVCRVLRGRSQAFLSPRVVSGTQRHMQLFYGSFCCIVGACASSAVLPIPSCPAKTSVNFPSAAEVVLRVKYRIRFVFYLYLFGARLDK